MSYCYTVFNTAIQLLTLHDGPALAEAYPTLIDCLNGATPPLLPVPADRDHPASKRLTAAFAGKETPGAALIMATSGTTGAPKGSRLSAAALRASIDATHHALGGPGRWLLAVPSHHIIGMQVILRSLTAGWEPVPLALSDGFDIEQLPAAIAELCSEGSRHYASLVPSQLDTLRRWSESADPRKRHAGHAAIDACTRLDAILSGGAPLPAHLRTLTKEWGLRVVRGYGSSEVGGGVLFDGIPGRASHLECDPRTGRIRISGHTLADGYVGMDNHPDWIRDDDGQRWFLTHDIGHWETDKHEVLRLSIDGRLDEAINSGGLMVIPQPLEAALDRHPAVAECAIIGLPHSHFGERVTAVVTLTESARPDTVTPADLLSAFGDIIEPLFGHHSIPRALYIVETLPRNANGKLRRRELRTNLASTPPVAQLKTTLG